MKKIVFVAALLVMVLSVAGAQDKSLEDFQKLILDGNYNQAGYEYINDKNPPMYVDINQDLGPIYSNEFRWLLKSISGHITGVEIYKEWMGIQISTDIPHRFEGKTHTPSGNEYYILMFIMGVDGLEINEVKFTPTK